MINGDNTWLPFHIGVIVFAVTVTITLIVALEAYIDSLAVRRIVAMAKINGARKRYINYRVMRDHADVIEQSVLFAAVAVMFIGPPHSVGMLLVILAVVEIIQTVVKVRQQAIRNRTLNDLARADAQEDEDKERI